MSSLDADSTAEAIKNTTAIMVSGIYGDLDTPNPNSNGDHINCKDATAVSDVHSQPKFLKPLQLIPISLFKRSAPTPPSPSSPPLSHQTPQHPPFPSDFQHDSPHLLNPTHSPQLSINLPPTSPPKAVVLASNIHFRRSCADSSGRVRNSALPYVNRHKLSTRGATYACVDRV